MSKQLRAYLGSTTGLEVWDVTDGAWARRSSALEGAVRVMTGRTDQPGTVFAGVMRDGLYRTTDAGGRWDKVFEGDVRSVAVDPHDQRVVYVGTEPVHLHRSEDGGETWSEVVTLQSLPEDIRRQWWGPTEPHEGHVMKILIDPDEPRVLYLGLEHGGIVRSTDRGATWADVSAGITYLDIHSIARDPSRQGAYFVSSARGFFRSDDPSGGWLHTDGSMPWGDSPEQNYSHDFVVLPKAEGADDVSIVVAGANGSPGFWRRPSRAECVILRSDDGARSWRELTNGLPDKPPQMAWALVAHPADPDRLLAGYSDDESGAGELYATEDRGDSWRRVDGAFPAVRSIWLEPA